MAIWSGNHDWRRRPLRIFRILRIILLTVGAVFLGFNFALEQFEQFTVKQVDFALTAIALLVTAIVILELVVYDSTYRREHGLSILVAIVTVAGGLVLAFLFSDETLTTAFGDDARDFLMRTWWRLTLFIWIGVGLLSSFAQIVNLIPHPATLVVVSFVLLIGVGTALLMFPSATQEAGSASFTTALFTATSAVCVTGLAVVDTGTYWTRSGQTIILILVQAGGLGIMLLGVSMTLVVGRGLLMRDAVMLGELFERRVIGDVKRLVFAVIVSTFGLELLGAFFLSTLWPHLPLADRAFYGLFHSVSAFCNAGFGLEPDSFESFSTDWRVCGVLAGLIILGGLGFPVIEDIGYAARQLYRKLMRRLLKGKSSPPVRLRLTTRLVLVTTLALLVMGTIGILFVESFARDNELSWLERFATAWFQSVTSRTAGFNTIPIGALHEGSQLLIILLMFVGASPASTGGGVKTTALAMLFLTARAIFRGREDVEAFGRTIPVEQTRRALLVVSLAATTVMAMTLFLVLSENQPGRFLDHIFETTSALATVGLSTGITPKVSTTGRLILVACMFMGRVGPLTLILGLAGKTTMKRYRYPEENVALG